MQATINVRRAEERDAAALLALRTQVFEETAFMLWEPGEFLDTEADERSRIARFNGQPNSLCLVAEDQGRLVGFLNAVGGQVRRQRHCTSLGLAVARSCWGQGVASTLLAHLLAWARGAGVTRVDLTVHTTNIRAINVYLRAGFQVEGVRRRSLWVAGGYVDEYLMAALSDA